MSSPWPVNIAFSEIILTIDETTCQACGSPLRFRKDRIHPVYSLKGPVKIICKQWGCSNSRCDHHHLLISPKAEYDLTMPRWRMSWDVFLWIGFRRYKRHWSVPQIQAELLDSYQIGLSVKTLTQYLRKYQLMVSARHQDVARLREAYQDCADVILTIDGLQPEKGHETVYVVRELRQQRVWFVETLLSSSTAEIQQVIQHARQIVEGLDKPVLGWMSDKQEAFVAAIAAEFPGTPHRYCSNHFLRDMAQLLLELDSHTKVQMRKKVRGLRTLEKATLSAEEQRSSEGMGLTPSQRAYAAQIVLDYCAAVRGILNDNHGGPLRPAGWRMAEALEAVIHSLERNLQQPMTPISAHLRRLQSYIQQGLTIYQQEKPRIAAYLNEITQVWDLVHPAQGSRHQHRAAFQRLAERFKLTEDPITSHMGQVMQHFEEGLFSGSEALDLPEDNLDLERWIKSPKGHERRVHGRQHVGLRVIAEGPTLLPALDAHLGRITPFTIQELRPYATAEAPASQKKAVARHRIMTRASSKKNEGLS
jgi:hypothetical protein